MIRWLSACLMAVAIVGCSKSPPAPKPDLEVIAQQAPPAGSTDLERAVKEMISTMNELAVTLERVQDARSADAAISKIESCGKKLMGLQKKIQEGRPSASEEENRKLGEKYEKELMVAVYRIKGATVQAVQRAPEMARQIARTLADARQLYASLDMFDVEERAYRDGARANRLMTLDRTLIGANFTHPVELRRLATTYYHRRGPIGVVLERFNWFPGPVNTYWADARLPASLAALAAGDALRASPMPVGPLVGVWSEPPIGVIGLEAGTLASYGRPFQDLHFYDKSDELKQLVLPSGGKPRRFHYLADALQRGCRVKVQTGALRATFSREAPDGYYHVLVVETSRGGTANIEMELLTREAMKLYFAKLTEQGTLCLHVSNRHLDLTSVVADLAESLGFACRHASDSDLKQDEDRGHSGSEWVMVARKNEYLQHLQAPPGYANRAEPFWRRPTPSGRPAWTDAGISAVKGLK
jgi:hypothetical protein